MTGIAPFRPWGSGAPGLQRGLERLGEPRHPGGVQTSGQFCDTAHRQLSLMPSLPGEDRAVLHFCDFSETLRAAEYHRLSCSCAAPQSRTLSGYGLLPGCRLSSHTLTVTGSLKGAVTKKGTLLNSIKCCKTQ